MTVKKNTLSDPEEYLAKAKKDALRLLSFRARSTQELRSRLQRKGHEKAVVEEALVFCARAGFLDDEKFAKLYVTSLLQSRPSGKRQIAFYLQNKGVSQGLVRRTLDSLEDFDEKQVALDLALRRHKSVSRLPEATAKARLYGFLRRRGFTGEAVSYALTRLYKDMGSFE